MRAASNQQIPHEIRENRVTVRTRGGVRWTGTAKCSLQLYVNATTIERRSVAGPVLFETLVLPPEVIHAIASNLRDDGRGGRARCVQW